jgi:hypothetical protein
VRKCLGTTAVTKPWPPIVTGIAKIVLAYREVDKPNLGTISRVAGRASRLLRISELDERMSVENAATLALAKKLSLVG